MPKTYRPRSNQPWSAAKSADQPEVSCNFLPPKRKRLIVGGLQRTDKSIYAEVGSDIVNPQTKNKSAAEKN